LFGNKENEFYCRLLTLISFKRIVNEEQGRAGGVALLLRVLDLSVLVSVGKAAVQNVRVY
jgi:hypothetical protein